MTPGHGSDAGATGQPAAEEAAAQRLRSRDINATIRYTMWSVFRQTSMLHDPPLDTAEWALKSIERATAGNDLSIRGWYDVAGLRADADIMVWWHAPAYETLQDAYHALRRSGLGSHLEPVWSQLALHRPAEFNKGHVPAFMAGEAPRDHLCVYPFVRSYEWYLLPDQERRQMLHEHGMLARPYPDVRANTVSAFALGDYEWMLAFEADDMYRIVDLMRDLRAAAARRHTREEVPFYTGRRRRLADILASW